MNLCMVIDSQPDVVKEILQDSHLVGDRPPELPGSRSSSKWDQAWGVLVLVYFVPTHVRLTIGLQ